MTRRTLVPLFVLAALWAAPGHAAAPKPARSWAAAEIRVVVAHGLLGAKDTASFRPDDPLTRGELESLIAGLAEATAPEPQPEDPYDPYPSDPADPVEPDDPPADEEPTDAATFAVRRTAGANANATVTMAQLDARLVQALGASDVAAQFARNARSAGLKVPSRFGTEVTARLLGLRTNHPTAQDALELLPDAPATRAEAAYSAARILGFRGFEGTELREAAGAFTLPALTPWQQRVLSTGARFIGYPYIWGGESEAAQSSFGAQVPGGFDCSGFVWRVFRLERYPGAGGLAGTLRGRTTYEMSGEVAKGKRIGLTKLQPADVLFWGAKGTRSKPSEVDHMGVYLGNGWFIHSSGYGVAVARLDGWYAQRFAWARRPLAEAGLA